MKIKILTTLLCFICFGLISLNAQEETPKVDKKIVIVKKTVDEDGNETVERIVKEGAEADQYIKEVHVDEKGNKEIKVRIKSAGDGENIWISDDNEVINLEGKKFEFHSDGHSLNGDVHKKIKIVTAGENGEEEVIEWDGEGEMPAELMKKLEGKGISVKSLNGGHEMFMIKNGDLDCDKVIDLDIDCSEDMTPEMKERIEKIHKEKGLHHDEDHDFVFQSSKINTNKAFLGVNIEDLEEGGVEVISVFEGSAAEDAGIKSGDLIISVSGNPIASVDELIESLTPFEPGDEVVIDLTRDGNKTQVKAALKERTDIHVNDENHDKEIEVIVISDCNTNFSGDEDIDLIFETIGDNEELKEITKEIIVIVDGEDVNEEIEVTVEVEEVFEEEEEAVKDEEVEVVEEVIELAPIVKSDRFKNMSRLNLKDFNAYPNPTDGLLNISFSGNKGPMLVQITDINGKEVYKKAVNDFNGQFNDQVNFEGLPKGSYVLYVIQEGRIYTDNIIFN